ncbi:MAG TPA: hypothetical protein VGZ47_02940 [Gemmataceae bacterium]|nr:hypothetical protein [Gemmataceae bacterium]
MRFVGILAVLLLFTVTIVRAERVPLSPEQQKAESTHIVTGTVKAIYGRDVETTLYGKGTRETHYVLEIEVQGVEKGKGIEKGDIIYARCWRLKQRGEAGLVPGPSGHFDIPKEGEQVRAFVAKGKYSPTGQSDNGFSLVYPNGIEKLKEK